jgi:putative peptidoglycan lipid II flippase
MSIRIRVATASMVVMAATMLVKLAGLGKQIYIAALFGTTGGMDAFIVSLLVPMLAAGLVAGSFNAALVPLYIDKREKEGADEADRFLLGLAARAGAVLLLLSVLLSVLSPYYVPLVGWGFSGETRAMAVSLSRILAFTVFLEGITALIGGMINARGRFGFPALTPMVVSLTVIVFLYLFQRLGVYALAWGTLAGSFLGLLWLAAYCPRLGFSWRAGGVGRNVDWRRFARLALPLLCGSAFASINLVVDKMMASTLVEGSVSALNYAGSIISAPVDLFIYAITTVILPYFAYQAVRGDAGGFKNSYNRAVSAAAVILAPVTFGIITLGLPAIRVVFQRGMFEPRSTLMTWQAAACFSLGLFPFAVGMMLVRYFTAIKDTLTICKVALVTVGVNVAGNYVFMQYMGHAGIALATSVTYCFSACLLLRVLAAREGKIINRDTMSRVAAVSAVAAGAGAAGLWINSLDVWPDAVSGLIAGAAALAASYAAGLWIFRRDVLLEVTGSLKG